MPYIPQFRQQQDDEEFWNSLGVADPQVNKYDVAGGMGATANTAPRPMAPARPDAVMDIRRAMEEARIHNSSAPDVKPSKLRTIIGAALGGFAGYSNPQAGHQIASGIVNQPQRRAMAEWERRGRAMQEGVDSQLKMLDFEEAQRQGDARIRQADAAIAASSAAERASGARGKLYEKQMNAPPKVEDTRTTSMKEADAIAMQELGLPSNHPAVMKRSAEILKEMNAKSPPGEPTEIRSWLWSAAQTLGLPVTDPKVIALANKLFLDGEKVKQQIAAAGLVGRGISNAEGSADLRKTGDEGVVMDWLGANRTPEMTAQDVIAKSVQDSRLTPRQRAMVRDKLARELNARGGNPGAGDFMKMADEFRGKLGIKGPAPTTPRTPPTVPSTTPPKSKAAPTAAAPKRRLSYDPTTDTLR